MERIRGIRSHMRTRREAEGTCVLPPNSEKIFFGQFLCKIRAFFGQNHVKLGNFVNFSGKNHVNSGVLIIFHIHIFRAKMSCPLKS